MPSDKVHKRKSFEAATAPPYTSAFGSEYAALMVQNIVCVLVEVSGLVFLIEIKAAVTRSFSRPHGRRVSRSTLMMLVVSFHRIVRL